MLRRCLVCLSWSLGFALILTGLAIAAQPTGAALPQIWIKGGAHLVNTPPVWRGIRDDRGDMWNPDAPWPMVASRVQVVEFPAFTIQWATDEDLQQAFSDMKRRHLALALGTGLLTRSDHCQSKTEAYGAAGGLEAMLEKIRRDGGDLRYIAMDEPYYWGRRDPGGCHESAAELARNVAQSVASARRIFPNVQIGDIEVVGASRAWIDELVQWTDAYRGVVGEKLAFFQTDIGWSELAMRNLAPLQAALKVRTIPFAIIYNAAADADTDASYEQSAQTHIAEIETALGIHPDIAVFDTWVAHPGHFLPERQPGTLTNLVLNYLRPASTLSVKRGGGALVGRTMVHPPMRNGSSRRASTSMRSKRRGSGPINCSSKAGRNPRLAPYPSRIRRAWPAWSTTISRTIIEMARR